MRKHVAPICATERNGVFACNRAMVKIESGIVIDCLIKDGNQSYYKVHADLWRCPECGTKIYDSFGSAIENFTEGYAEIETTVKARIE